MYGTSEIYIRLYNSFLGKVDKMKYPKVSQENRFELQDIKSVKKSIFSSFLLF